MIQNLFRSSWFKNIALVVLAAFISAIPAQSGFTQVITPMPLPGEMAYTSSAFEPARMVGLRMDFKDPFNFYFVMNKGGEPLALDIKSEEYNKLIKYFLASLTTPNKDMWVNLSPYESNRIIPDNFALTDMGRDLLAQDYLLKQFTASLMYPEDAAGKEFWAKVYAKAFEQFGTTDVPVNTFNKVWIMADQAEIYQKDDTILLIDSHLKVMLEQDFMAVEHNKEQFGSAHQERTQTAASALASDIVRDVIVPIIEKEVNEGTNFARVRQIYNSMILASWFKKTLIKSLLGQVYADKNKAAGIETLDTNAKEKIYQQYLDAYKTGVFDFIKEDLDPLTQETFPRKYFSGGMVPFNPDNAQQIADPRDAAIKIAKEAGNFDAAMTTFQMRIAGAFMLVFNCIN